MLPPGLRPRTYWEGAAIENRYWRSSLGPALLGLWACFLESYGPTHRRGHTLKFTENCQGSPWWGVQRKACRQWHNTGEGLPGKWVMRKCPIQHLLHRDLRAVCWEWSQEVHWKWHTATRLPEGMLAAAAMGRGQVLLASQYKRKLHTYCWSWQRGSPEPGGEKCFLLQCPCSRLTKDTICKLAKEKYLKNPAIFSQGGNGDGFGAEN